jgi:hypothetical protein
VHRKRKKDSGRELVQSKNFIEMKQELNTELIERYLRGELRSDELGDFELRLKHDEKLREEVELQSLFVRGVENAGMRSAMDAIHQSLYPVKVSFFQSGWINLLAGGSFGALMIAALLFSLNNQNAALNAIPDKDPILSDVIVSPENTARAKDLKDSEQTLARKNYPASILPAQMKNYIFSFPGHEIQGRLHIINAMKDTVIKGQQGTRILIPKNCFQYPDGKNMPARYSIELKEAYNNSDLIMHDLTGELDYESRESNGAIHISMADPGKDLLFAPEKKIQVQFKDEKDLKTGKVIPIDKQNVVYYKLFDDQPESRLIALPNDVLDYELNYVSKASNDAGRTMNEKIESLMDEKYWNTYISTIQFHHRIEGCMLYSESTDLLDIYLKNTNLKLWQADSLVADYLKSKALNDCKAYARYMKAEEYFRWLKSQKWGNITIIERLQNRNYHKGQFYNNIPNNRELGRLQKWGLTGDEAFNMLEFFKKIYVHKSKFFQARHNGTPLDYYYLDQGRYISYEITDCGQAGKNSMELSSFLSVNKFGWVNYEKYTAQVEGNSLRINIITGDSSLPAKVYLVLKDQNSVMGGSWTKSGYNYFPAIPGGKDIIVVGLSYDDDKIWFGQKKITTGKSNQLEIFLEPMPAERVKAILTELN